METARHPRLLDQVRACCRVRHDSLRTEQAYVHWIRRFILFHGNRHPREMVRAVLARLDGVRWLRASLMYGSGPPPG